MSSILDSETDQAGKKLVKNIFPTMSAPYRLAVVGEAPGANEEHQGVPFVGASGQLLEALLQNAGIRRDACFIGNICQYRPPQNLIWKFDWNGPEIQSGIACLQKDLEAFNPNMVLLLGNTALHAFKTELPFPRTKAGPKPLYSITAWRGSLFNATALLKGVKCLATFHPAALLRSWGDASLVRYDLIRVRKEAETTDLIIPPRDIYVDAEFVTICRLLDETYIYKPTIGVDIEGSTSGIKCCSIAERPDKCYVVPFENMDGSSYWTEDQEFEIMWRFTRIMVDDSIKKVLQNGLYDRFVMAWVFRLLVRGQTEDTMFKTWEFMCEWDKGLEIQSSIYTRQPYYASDIITDKKAKTYWARLAGVEPKKFWLYCGLDSAVTLESSLVLDRTLKGSSIDHYRFNINLLNPFLYMELRGIKLDIAERDRRIQQLNWDKVPLQDEVNTAAGFDLNVKSPMQMKKFLYEVLKLPMQFKRGVRDDDGNQKVTSDYTAILKLAHKTKNPILMKVIRLQEMRKRVSDLETLTTDKDGRIRFSYNPVGSVTGRTTCFGCPTGSGTNGQTLSDSNDELFDNAIMKLGMRDLLLANDDHWMAQADLRGADAWTVAAHCARLGDHTMLDDLLAGMKIPRIIALIVKHGVGINQLPRDILKERCKEINTEEHLYFSCKQVQHGTNYGMKPPTVALRVFLESYGNVYISDAQAKQYQDAYLSRYKGILRWHDWMREQIYKGFYFSATGHKRIFTGRKGSDDTLREVLSDEPQQNTTYATNRAALSLWRSEHNRVQQDGIRFKIEPLHQVHDALVVQFQNEHTTWALDQIKSYFANPLIIAGIELTIPFDGKYGSSWGNLKEGKIV